MKDEVFKEMLVKAVAKVGRMRPLPPNEDFKHESWEKVDDLIKKALIFMKQNGEAMPLQKLMSHLVEWAFQDITNAALQALAGRSLDTWLLTYESRRFGAILRGKGLFSVPDTPWNMPITFGDELYRVGIKTALTMINTELRKRKLVERRDEED